MVGKIGQGERSLSRFAVGQSGHPVIVKMLIPQGHFDGVGISGVPGMLRSRWASSTATFSSPWFRGSCSHSELRTVVTLTQSAKSPSRPASIFRMYRSEEDGEALSVKSARFIQRESMFKTPESFTFPAGAVFSSCLHKPTAFGRGDKSEKPVGRLAARMWENRTGEWSGPAEIRDRASPNKQTPAAIAIDLPSARFYIKNDFQTKI